MSKPYFDYEDNSIFSGLENVVGEHLLPRDKGGGGGMLKLTYLIVYILGKH